MKQRILKLSAGIIAALSLAAVAAALCISIIGAKDELVYIFGKAAEWYIQLLLEAAAVCIGVWCSVFLRHSRKPGTAASMVITLLSTVFVLGGGLLMTNTLVNTHRYYMYNNMYNYGGHRILHANDGEDFVLYQQCGKYTFKEFYRSDTAIDSPDIIWGENSFGVIVGEEQGEPEETKLIVEWFEYSEYNKK